MNTFTESAHNTQWIPIKHLSVVWAAAQREYDERWASKIAGEFDPDLFDDLVVTLPNGNGIYHVIDGQHRRGAICSLYGEEEKVPCRVLEVKDPARAAAIFDKINNSRRKLSPLVKFKVRVTAGHESEVAINNLVTSLGLRIENGDTSRSVRAVSALLNVSNTFGLSVLKEALMAIIATWDNDKGAFEGPIIEGFGAFAGEHRHVDWVSLREKTAKAYTPGRLIAHAKADKEIHGGRVADGVKRVLTRNYNTGRRTGKLGE